jgi:hypothetical protein
MDSSLLAEYAVVAFSLLKILRSLLSGSLHCLPLLSSIKPVQEYNKTIAQYFMPYGKKYSMHMPFGKGSGQRDSTLCHTMARSIPSTCLLARARVNEGVLYAIWQEVFLAHDAFWQGLGE